MKFRPCIDLHSGVVKQIVGSTLTDKDDDPALAENFASAEPASYYANMVRRFMALRFLLMPECILYTHPPSSLSHGHTQ